MRTVHLLAGYVSCALSAALTVPPNAQWYTLQTKSQAQTSSRLLLAHDQLTQPSQINTLSNLFLTAKDGAVAAFPGARENAAVGGKFFTADYSNTGTLSILVGDDTHQLGLSGTNGLLLLVDLINPTGDTIPKDKPTEWSVFKIKADGEVVVSDGQNIPSRSWVTFLDTDGVYYVGLWDGVTLQQRTVANVTLIATKSIGPKMF